MIDRAVSLLLVVLVVFLLYKTHTASTKQELLQLQLLAEQQQQTSLLRERLREAKQNAETVDSWNSLQLDEWLCGTEALEDC